MGEAFLAHPFGPETDGQKAEQLNSIMTGRRQGICGLAALAALTGLSAASLPVLADDEQLITLAAPAASDEASPALALGEAKPVSDEVLGTENAKAAIQIEKLIVNDQNLQGVVQGNVAMNTSSGNNAISGEAFQDAAGFVTVIQNTGHNVLIQNSTIVNVAVEP